MLKTSYTRMHDYIQSIFTFGLLLSLPLSSNGSSDRVTEADIAECGMTFFARVECASINSYRQCIVPGADNINAIKVPKRYSDDVCTFKDTFGYRTNVVWVDRGCSGEFYICFTGVSDPSKTISPTAEQTTKPTLADVDVPGASTFTEPHNVVIYIIIGSVIVILFGGGLMMGCVIKRRHQREKSRRIAAKRQIRIDQQREKREQLEGTTKNLAMQTTSLDTASEINNRSTSVEFIHPYTNQDNDREGSICSDQSSNSGFTSVSCMTTGRMVPSYNKRLSLDQPIQRGTSIPDIQSALRQYCSESNGLNSKKSKYIGSNISGSQTSLESIREVCSRYKVFEIPLEKRFVNPNLFKRPAKYNTVGFSGSSLEKAMVKNGNMALPTRNRMVTALVHAVNGETSIERNKQLTYKENNAEVATVSHYENPESLFSTTQSAIQSANRLQPGDKVTPWSSINEGIQQDLIERSKDTNAADSMDSGHCSPIYATVNKRNKLNVQCEDVRLVEKERGKVNIDKCTHKTKLDDTPDTHEHTSTLNSKGSIHTSNLESFKPDEDFVYNSIKVKQSHSNKQAVSLKIDGV